MRKPNQPVKATNLDIDALTPTGRHAGVGDKGKQNLIGSIATPATDTYTYDVLAGGRTLQGVPRMRSSPGDIAQLEIGTEVLLSFDYGVPIILGILSTPSSGSTDANKHSIDDTEGFGGQGSNKNTSTTHGNYRLAHEPDNMMPGDWTQIGPEGNCISVLAGGVSALRSTPMAQIRTHVFNELVEIFSRNFTHYSDMGISEIKNRDGRVTWSFRGGSDQRTEAGPDEQKWTIKMDLGAGDDFFNFELCTPNQQTLFNFKVTGDGQCEIYGLNGVSVNSGSQSGGTSAEENTGDKIRSIGGNNTVNIEGSNNQVVKGNSEETVYTDARVSTGNDLSHNAMRDYGVSAGRNMAVSVIGPLTNPVGTAMSYNIFTGNWVVDIGGPLSPNPLSGFSMTTYAGDMAFNSLAAGNFKVTSPLGNLETNTLKAVISTNLIPDSVILGGNFLASHLVKFEQLDLHLKALYNLLDTHIHLENGTAVAAGIPVIGVSGTPPPGYFSSIMSPQTLTFKSITTGVSL